MNYAEKIDRLRLFRSENVGAVTFRVLTKHFKTAAEALDALPEKARRGGMKKPLRICSADDAEREYAAVEKFGAEMIFLGGNDYPDRLSVLPDAPPVLTVLGDKSLLKSPQIAIVGTRNASLNGREIARNMARELALAGYGTVSGMASGIDGAAHFGALQANTPRASTTAVLGTGIDIPYPEQNRKLYDEIREKGALVSEYPLHAKPQPSNFPQRNRIISGLSIGLVVIEAALRSGSLITANKALEQGKDVFAVPATPTDDRAKGVNHLIKNGAPLVENASDIIEHLQSAPLFSLSEKAFIRSDPPIPPALPSEPDDTDRNRVLSLLDGAPVEIDLLIRETGLPADAISVLLVELELAGQIERLPGSRVLRVISL